MTAPEMHVMFRQYAQQMGMQNVRAILPEQIDLVLNTSVMDIVNSIIKENIGITNDRIITDNSKIGQVNALRSLYKVAIIEMSPTPSQIEEKRAFSFSSADKNTGRMTTDFAKISDNKIIPDYMFLVDFSLNYKKVVNQLGYNGKTGVSSKGTYSVLTPEAVITGDTVFEKNNIAIENTVYIETFVNDPGAFVELPYTVDTSVTNNPRLKCVDERYSAYYLGVEGVNIQNSSYGGKHYVLTKTFEDGNEDYNQGIIYNPLVINTSLRSSDYVAPTFDTDGLETNYFPVRFIDDTYLSNVLNDFILAPRFYSPIIVVYNNNTFDIYIDKFIKVERNNNVRYVLPNDLIPYKLRMSYISKPVEIRYSEDISKPNQDCDLPDYIHVDVVKHAVDIYHAAINNSLMKPQSQEKVAQ